MLIKKDDFITRNDLITFGAGATTALLFLPMPIALGTGVITLALFKSLKASMFSQNERANLLSFFRVTNAQIRNLNIQGVGMTFIALEALTAIIDHYAGVSNMFYPMHLLTAVPVWLGLYFKNNCLKVNHLQNKADFQFSGDVQILDSLPGKVVVHSKTQLKDEASMELIVNSHIRSIEQDLYRKNIYTVKHDYGKESKYRKLEKGSIERLEQILIDMKGKPKVVNATMDKYQETFIFTTTLPLKRLLRATQDIEHKLGLKKNTLTIIDENGCLEFQIKKANQITYYLDDIMESTKRPTNMLLPMVVGVEASTGKIILGDLTKLTHILIGGMTNTGKSCTFNGMIDSLLYWNYSKVVVFTTDFKNSAFVKYKKIPNCYKIETTELEQMKFYEMIYYEYKARMKKLEDTADSLDCECRDIGQYNEIHKDKQLPYIIICSDEINTACQFAWKKKFNIDGNEFDFENIRTFVYTKGRSLGIHMLDSVQKATAGQYFKSWRASIDTRICHKMAEVSEVDYIIQMDKALVACGLGQTQGEFIYKDHQSEIYKMKGAFIDEKNSRVFEEIKKLKKTKNINRVEADISDSKAVQQ